MFDESSLKKRHLKDLEKKPSALGNENTAEKFNTRFFGQIETTGSDDEEDGNINKYQQMMNQKRFLTYIKQIKYTLKSVLSKKQLFKVKEKIEQGLSDY